MGKHLQTGLQKQKDYYIRLLVHQGVLPSEQEGDTLTISELELECRKHQLLIQPPVTKIFFIKTI